MEILVFDEAEPLPPRLAADIRDLFTTHYHNYHYLYELGDEARVRLVGLEDGGTVGFASFKIVGGFAHLANLLVAERVRGRGLARQLEWARIEDIRARGLRGYVSCTCETVASQKLKTEIGLAPTCVKYGYRIGVVGPDRVGSAVVYADRPFDIAPPSAWRVERDPRQERVRWYASAAAELEDIGLYDGRAFVQILTGPELLVAMCCDLRFAFTGFDLDLSHGTWHYSFQLKNDRYRRGIDARPEILVDLASATPAHLPVAWVT